MHTLCTIACYIICVYPYEAFKVWYPLFVLNIRTKGYWMAHGNWSHPDDLNVSQKYVYYQWYSSFIWGHHTWSRCSSINLINYILWSLFRSSVSLLSIAVSTTGLKRLDSPTKDYLARQSIQYRNKANAPITLFAEPKKENKGFSV